MEGSSRKQLGRFTAIHRHYRSRIAVSWQFERTKPGLKLTFEYIDVDRINEAIDKIRQPLDAKVREERIIRAG
jgi:hypothetical protein